MPDEWRNGMTVPIPKKGDLKKMRKLQTDNFTQRHLHGVNYINRKKDLVNSYWKIPVWIHKT